ncbi:MAG: fasciclin domain-containing protein [Flavobacteriaceae bacterium]|nr:fasciclin domain-containing protein [Flavobacteriaceae bacterium]
MSLLFVTTSCDDDDDKPSDNIVEVAQSNSELSTLVSAIVAAELDTYLAGPGPVYLVFAPTNAAFAKLDSQTLNNIIGDPVLLTALVQYHVVSGKVYSKDLSTGSVNTALSGQALDVVVSGGMVTINGSAKVIEADVKASNGVIHIIDEVLLPDDFVAQTIVQIAASNPNFSTLVSILSLPEMSDLLAAANNPTQDLTVFAPTNAAFDAVLAALGKTSLNDLPTGILKEMVQYHILGQSVLSTQLTNGQVPTLLPGESVTVNVSGGVKIDNANVIAADVKAINGVIHAVDAVLLPSYVITSLGNIGEVVLFNKDYTILAAALRKAELLDAISTTDNITVFAPDNAAFVKAGITSLDGLDKDALSPILLYHVLGAKVLSSQLPAGGIATTLSSDQKIYLGYLTNGVLINGLTSIYSSGYEKDNGVIHTIDRTLVPPAIDIVDIAAALANNGAASEFTVLVSILSNPAYADVTAAIKAADNITVFAPTDAAFAEISGVIPTLTEAQIKNILYYHAVGARVFSSQLVNNQVVPMLNGQTTKVIINAGAVSLVDKSGGDNANVIQVNVHGSNGVIHVIDKVLLPAL